MSHERFAKINAFTYIQLQPGLTHKTLTFPPVDEEFPQVLLDLAEDGTVLGVEILVPGKMCGCWEDSDTPNH